MFYIPMGNTTFAGSAIFYVDYNFNVTSFTSACLIASTLKISQHKLETAFPVEAHVLRRSRKGLMCGRG